MAGYKAIELVCLYYVHIMYLVHFMSYGWLHVIILTSRMLSIMGKWEQACGDSVESSFKL